MSAPGPISEPFWRAAAKGVLAIQRCSSCRTAILYPRARCPRCGSRSLAWEPAHGLATLYSFSVVRRAVHPAFRARLPYVYALVELYEGPRLVTNVVDCDISALRIGMELEVVFEMSGDIAVPLFRPARGDRRIE
ncbi:MAG: Zn-ribbon domain-containing OB-fold protein [Actinophytocola sp.]